MKEWRVADHGTWCSLNMGERLVLSLGPEEDIPGRNIAELLNAADDLAEAIDEAFKDIDNVAWADIALALAVFRGARGEALL